MKSSRRARSPIDAPAKPAILRTVLSLAVLSAGCLAARPLYSGSIPADTTTVRLVAQLGHTNPIMSVAFSPDGRRVLTGSTDRTARSWDVDTGAERLLIEGGLDGITADPLFQRPGLFDFGAGRRDGDLILSGGPDPAARGVP